MIKNTFPTAKIFISAQVLFDLASEKIEIKPNLKKIEKILLTH